jgi:hypothetical protein
VEAIVDLAPGVEHNPLALRLSERLQQSLLDEGQCSVFRHIRGSVVLIATDLETSVTLRFDFGQLTVHEGRLGIPDLTVCGTSAALAHLGRLRFPWRVSLPDPLSRVGRRALAELLALTRLHELKVYGLFTHARLFARLCRLLSDGSDRVESNPDTVLDEDSAG